ncbi:MAG: bifunctional 4-hydroxy-2-oxoglutarate aldolase/2-dehydro-3-deoxy-phosphogluconate aldolase [Candidatus Omnitrophica bacterium]|nr:bifunctional 4-hydroxy-2-oxoglutarate aldolase/2-dehydro-3-deoxy-phosphogluconate aldolase [Candidatus Omnitrophota bacterium]
MQQPTIKWFDDYKFVACVRSSSPSDAESMIKAAIDGGFRVFEISLNTPQAFKLIESYSKKDSLLIGAGTVSDGEAAQKAINAGASFISSNYTDRDVINVARHNDTFVIQGVSTPTEASTAHHYGADCVKFFPAAFIGGTDYLRAMRDNLPFVKFVAEGSIDPVNAFEYLKYCIGVFFDKTLYDRHLVRQNNWAEITERAKRLTQKLESSLKVAR